MITKTHQCVRLVQAMVKSKQRLQILYLLFLRYEHRIKEKEQRLVGLDQDNVSEGHGLPADCYFSGLPL